jgi:predicted SPOUT superfamily RNA methylase MTH1
LFDSWSLIQKFQLISEQNENNERLVKVLEYLECPQYLRKALFPPHRYLEAVGLLNPIETPHHLRKTDQWEYREGVVVDMPNKDGKGSFVDIGLMHVSFLLISNLKQLDVYFEICF